MFQYVCPDGPYVTRPTLKVGNPQMAWISVRQDTTQWDRIHTVENKRRTMKRNI